MLAKRIWLTSFAIVQLFWFTRIEAQTSTRSFENLLQKVPTRAVGFTDSISTSEQGVIIPINEVQEVRFLNLFEMDTVYLLYKVSISDSFHTVVLGYDAEDIERHKLITLNKRDFKPIASIDIAERHQTEPFPALQTLIHPRGFTLINIPNRAHRNYTHYLFTLEGTFIPTVYVDWKTLIYQGKLKAIRPVKNRNGALVTNSLSKVTDTLSYGEDVYVINYNSTTGNALIIKSYSLYLDDLLVLHDSANFGFVAIKDLYKGNGFNHDQSQYAEGESDPAYLYYYTRSIAIKDPYTTVTDLDIREFIEIERIDWEKYKDRIFVAEDSMINTFFFPYQEGDVTLPFANGTTLTLRDSTNNNMEYQPTDHYQLVENNKFKNHYLIYNSFFESYQFLLLDKSTSDTTGIFQGYPFVSPRRNYVVSFDTPYTYGQGETKMELLTLEGKRYQHELTAVFSNWNVPRTKHIYWLSNTEFILKVKPVEDAYTKEEDAEFFYLKFTILI